jgi:hypothetical protein
MLTARPSPPLRYVSCSPGGRGTRRVEPIRLGWSPVPPGNDAKETARSETRFLEKPHRGPGEGTHGKGPEAHRTLLTSLFIKVAKVSSGPTL